MTGIRSSIERSSLEQHHPVDGVGEATAKRHPGTGSSVLADQPWVAWSSRSDAAGRVVAEWMPNGQAGAAGDLGATVIGSDRYYTYDPAGRLVAVQDWTGNPVGGAVVPCTLRTYGFDANGNRTSQGSATASSGTCATSAPTTATRAYDVADRPTTGANGSGSYTYDQFGRQTAIPAADSPGSPAVATSLGYFDNDLVASISAASETVSFTLDAVLRRRTQTTMNSSGTSSIVRHYADGSDNPTWTVGTAAGQATTNRYAELVSGDLGLTITTTTAGVTAQLAVSGPRGDVVSEITLPADATAPGVGGNAAGLDSWSDYDEYGNPKQAIAGGSAGAAGAGYGWLGAKQRSTTEHGFTLMGVRVYNPATGMFTSLDPIHHANENAYGYPADPVNLQDYSGLNPGAVLGAVGVSIFAALAIAVGFTAAVLIIGTMAEQLKRYNAWTASSLLVRAVPKTAKVASRVARPMYTNFNRNNKYRLYEILYRMGRSLKTFKYGITMQSGNKHRMSA